MEVCIYMRKRNVTLRINEDIWLKSEKVLNSMGLSRSAFIEIVLSGVIQEKDFKETMKETIGKIIDHVKLKL